MRINRTISELCISLILICGSANVMAQSETAKTPATKGTVQKQARVTPTLDDPYARAGGLYSIVEGETVVLDASNSHGKFPIVTYEWSVEGKVLGSSETLSLDNLSAGTHEIELTVFDEKGGQDLDIALVDVEKAIIAEILHTQIKGHTANKNSTNKFSVYLSKPPKDTVTVNISSSNPLEGVPSRKQFTFNPSTKSRRLQIIGTNEDTANGVQDYKVVIGPATSKDPEFDGIGPVVVHMRGIHLELLSPAKLPLIFTPEEKKTIEIGTRYSGSQTLKYELLSSPEGMRINAKTGSISWSPAKELQGENLEISIGVSEQVTSATKHSELGRSLRSSRLNIPIRVARVVNLNTTYNAGIHWVTDSSFSLDGIGYRTPTDSASKPIITVKGLSQFEFSSKVKFVTELFYIPDVKQGIVELYIPLDKFSDGIDLALVSIYHFTSSDEITDNLGGHDYFVPTSGISEIVTRKSRQYAVIKTKYLGREMVLAEREPTKGIPIDPRELDSFAPK